MRAKKKKSCVYNFVQCIYANCIISKVHISSNCAANSHIVELQKVLKSNYIFKTISSVIYEICCILNPIVLCKRQKVDHTYSFKDQLRIH